MDRMGWKRFALPVSLLVLGLAVAALVGCGADGGLFSDPDNWGTVTGRVLDLNGQKLVGASVNAGGRKGTTDSDGNFSIGSVPTGQQTVAASMANYIDLGEGTKQVQCTKQGAVSAGNLVLVPWESSSRTVFMWQLQPTATGGWFDEPRRQDQLLLGGTRYLNGMRGSVRYDGTQSLWRLNLGRRFSRLQFPAGVADDEDDVDANVVFLFKGDGTELIQTSAVKVGQVAQVDLDVSNVLILDIISFAVQDTADWPSVDVAWGDPKLTVK